MKKITKKNSEQTLHDWVAISVLLVPFPGDWAFPSIWVPSFNLQMGPPDGDSSNIIIYHSHTHTHATHSDHHPPPHPPPHPHSLGLSHRILQSTWLFLLIII